LREVTRRLGRLARTHAVWVVYVQTGEIAAFLEAGFQRRMPAAAGGRDPGLILTCRQDPGTPDR
ncbi:MAG: hypothetical protein ACKOET_15595, partial [Verrucomicrobiota bacterium]